jgi:1,4-alpha-glucan branching enzyme
MPYVEGFGTWPFGEEWLWEAVACVYLPLLERLRGAPLTISLTPVLCDQLQALQGPTGERFRTFLRRTRAGLHEQDAERFERAGAAEMASEVRRAGEDYAQADRAFAKRGGDLLAGFAELAGSAELWTSAATHAILPLLATSAGLRLQIAAGIASHRDRFGAWSGGFWLPECAYAAGIEARLGDEGVRVFCVDQTAMLGLGSQDHLETIAAAGTDLVAIPIDWQLARLVWDGPAGYPGAPAHRDYDRATDNAIKLWCNDGGRYDAGEARALARRQARDFLRRVAARLDSYRAQRDRDGLICVALDTEILGHWWYEGLEWLEAVIVAAPQHRIRLATLPAALWRHEPVARPLALSSWGRHKDLSTWDSPAVCDIAAIAREAELLTVAAAQRAGAAGNRSPAIRRAVRELLALQASDWAFMRSYGRAGRYPEQRVAAHRSALEQALAGAGDPPNACLRHLAPALDIAPLL